MKISIIFFCRNQYENLRKIYGKYHNSKLKRIIVNNDFNVIRDFILLIRIFFEYINLSFFRIFYNKRFISNNKINFKFNLNLFLSSKYTFKLTKNIIEILEETKSLTNLITTYEGHAFEKILFNYCYEKKIKSFGYFFFGYKGI